MAATIPSTRFIAFASELENAVERAVALERDSESGESYALERHVRDIERRYITEALRRTDGVKVEAAELLGMSFRKK